LKDTVSDLSYQIIAEISEKDHRDLEIIFSEYENFSYIEQVPKMKLVIPLPKKLDDKFIYEGNLFQDYDLDYPTIWSMYLSTICYIAGHARISDYRIYQEWMRGKTEDICIKTINFIENTRVENILVNKFPEYWENISKIKAKFNAIWEEKGKEDKENYSKKIFAEHFDPELKNKIKQIKKQICEIKQGNIHEFLHIANKIYNNQTLLEQQILPFHLHHKFDQKITRYQKNCKVKPSGKFEEIVNLCSELWVDQKISEEKMFRKYNKVSKELNFDKVKLGTENFGEYLRLKDETSLFIKKLRTQLKSIKNVIDDPLTEDIGLVEMQKAIQAIASENTNTKIFEQDESRRIEEHWAIVMDTSASMKLSFEDMKKFALCLGETADELNSREGEWGMFCFNNNFVIVKDKDEKYNQKVKSRIGGISNEGLSFIPDAVTMATGLLDQENTQRKYIFLITDGQSIGIPEVENEFSRAIINARKKGINVVGIGIPEGQSKYFTVSMPNDELRKIVAKFINAYIEIAQQNM